MGGGDNDLLTKGTNTPSPRKTAPEWPEQPEQPEQPGFSPLGSRSHPALEHQPPPHWLCFNCSDVPGSALPQGLCTCSFPHGVRDTKSSETFLGTSTPQSKLGPAVFPLTGLFYEDSGTPPVCTPADAGRVHLRASTVSRGQQHSAWHKGRT